jgi:cold shock CspA family protein
MPRPFLLAAILAAACVPPGAAADGQASLGVLGDVVCEPGAPLRASVPVTNRGTAAVPAVLAWSLQADPFYADPPLPDAQLGVDHALGARTTLAVDGVARGDSQLCDGDDASNYETPWGKLKEVVATIDLGSVRQVSAVRWIAGDANWIFKVDVATSNDGSAWTPVAGAQDVELKGRWGGPHALPWAAPVGARHLRLRFHNGGAAVDSMRLPVTIQVFDGAANDTLAIPVVGARVAGGTVQAEIPANGSAPLAIAGGDALAPGAYLLGLDLGSGGRHELRWSHVFVMPADAVPAARARRFGINGAEAKLAASMRRCGFGWMRFENAKWMMYMPKADRVAFDGSVAPWHVDLEGIFGAYQANDIRVLPYVFQTPDWATSAPPTVKDNRAAWPPKDHAAYGEAVFQLVARYGGRQVEAARLLSADKKSGLGLIGAVELWNEPNLNDPGWGPFVGPIGLYFDVLRAGIEGARRADPALPVSAAGWAGIDLEIVGQLAEHRYADGKTPLDLVDIVNVHFYSGREEPEICGWDPNVDRNGPATRGATYPEQLEALVAWRDLHKPKAEIWLTEIGNDVGGPMGRSERHQAAKLPRGIMMALAAGIERVFIYREKGSDPSQHAGSGLLRNDGSVRPAWLTVATMIRQLQGFSGRALRLPHPDPKVWLFLWQDGTRRVISGWTHGDAAKLGVELGKGAQCDAFGRATAVASTTDLALGYAPTYLTLAGETPALAKLVAEARQRDAAQAAERERRDRLVVRCFDFGSAAHVGVLKGVGLPRRFTAVGKDKLWNEADGYGFTKPAAGEEDMHWIADALERDGCRVGNDTAFKVRVPAGKHRVRLSATPQGDGAVTASIAGQGGKLTRDQHVLEVIVEGGAEPLSVGLDGWGVLRWLTIVPEAP